MQAGRCAAQSCGVWPRRKTLEDLTARWPQREAPWVLRLRLAAALRDGAAIQKTLRQIEEKEVYLSAKGREVVRFWQGKQQ